MKRSEWLAVAAIVVGGAAAYASSFHGTYVLDDPGSITDNPTIRHLADLKQILTPQSGSGLTVVGRPLLNLSFALNYAVSGTAPWSYHALNLLIHLGAALVLFGLLRRLMTVGPAAAVALLWAVHPLNTESVTYVVQRAESLMGLFYLLTVYFFVRGCGAGSEVGGGLRTRGDLPSVARVQRAQEGPSYAPRCGATEGEKTGRRAKWGWFGLSLAACLFGVFTKEVIVSAPLVVLVLDRLRFAGSFAAAWRRRRGYYLALAGTWVVLGLLVWHTGNRGGTSGFGSDTSAWRYWATQPEALVRYLRLSFWPHPLVFDTGTEWAKSASQVIIPLLGVAALAAATVHGLIRNRPWGLLGLAFFAILAPTSLVPGNRQTAAEHRMYLALIPVLVAAVGLLWRKKSLRALPFILAVPAAAATAVRNLDYTSALRLYGDAAARMPDNPYAQANFGTALLQDGRYVEARARFETALRLEPNLPDTAGNLGDVCFGLGQYPAAAVWYRRAVARNPQSAELRYNLAQACLKLGQVEDARREVEIALRLKPAMPGARGTLGLVLLDEGRLPEALKELASAVAQDPGNVEELINWGNALRMARRPEEAAARYAAAARLAPRNALIFYNWGGAMFDLQRYAAAETLLRRAVQLAPGNASAHQNLGNALFAEDQPEAALVEYAEAVRLAPKHAAAHYNYGRGLWRAGRRGEAVIEFQEARRLDPQFEPARRMLQALGLEAAGQ